MVTPAASCATADRAYLAAAHAPLSGSFEPVVDQRFTVSPLEAFHRGPARRPAISDWRAERLRGWIARIAVTGPDRASEDQYAESLGYTVGRFPLVPLVGPVVKHNPGILEVYQTNADYRTVSGAGDYMKILASSAHAAEITRETDNGIAIPPAIAMWLAGGDESVAYETPQYLRKGAGPTERFITFSVRFGRYVLGLSVQGGAGLDPAAAIVVLDAAAMSLTQSCGMAPATLHTD